MEEFSDDIHDGLWTHQKIQSNLTFKMAIFHNPFYLAYLI